MSAHNLLSNLYKAFAAGVGGNIVDPGAGGTIDLRGRSGCLCEVTTTGAETRVLPDAADQPAGVTVRVNLNQYGGNLTMTANHSTGTTFTFADEGDNAEFTVLTVNDVKGWWATTLDGVAVS